MNEHHPAHKRVLSFRQTAQNYPAFSVGSLRWLRFNGDYNGFNKCVIAVGRKLLIDADVFESWLENQHEVA